MRLSCKPMSVISTLFVAVLIQLALVAPLQATSLPLFGPEKFGREAGAPETFSRTFAACNIDARYRLVMENGAAGKDRVSAATISLNGVDVVRPSDLNQRVERIEKEVALQGENTLVVRLASNPGGFLTVSLFCLSGCLDLEISSPTPGSTMDRARVLVQGRLVNAPEEVGVVLVSAGVEGETAELAQVQGDLFAGLVPLHVGENTLSATVTDACGYQVSKDIVVHTDVARENVRLSVWPDNGVLPTGTGALELTLKANVNLTSLEVRYDWDFDGDGTAEQSGNDLAETVARYQRPGLYLPSVTVTDEQGNIYNDAAVVLVLSQEEVDALLQEKWEKMRNALVADDVNSALKYFAGGQESKYKPVLEKLRGKFTEIFSADEQLSFFSSFGNRIEYENLVIEGDKAFSYPIIFVRDANGLWKILQF